MQFNAFFALNWNYQIIHKYEWVGHGWVMGGSCPAPIASRDPELCWRMDGWKDGWTDGQTGSKIVLDYMGTIFEIIGLLSILTQSSYFWP